MERTTVSNIHVGCSGWVYRHWRGIFYPEGLPQKRWFERYAEEFDTVEINASFYRLPLASTFEGWRNKAPPGFRYAVKVNRFITHMKKLLDCAEAADQFIALARPLGETLGPLLYQLPPSLKLDLARLENFLAPPGASFCVHDMPGSKTERIAVGPIAYVRFHGGEGKYWGRHSDEGLLSWTDWIVEQSRQGRSVWCYFNNDIH